MAGGEIMTMPGRILGIGVGPGDPDLITLKAVRALEGADVVAYPAPLEGESVARKIAQPHIPDGVEELPIRMAMDPRRYPQQDVYDWAEGEISARVEAGRCVVILCEGDPFFYGSFMYLFERLTRRWPVEIVPGVSSLTACAAQLGMPLAARDDALAVIPATLDEDDITARLAAADTAAIIKVGRHLAKVRRALERGGLLEHAHYIEHATMADQQISQLADKKDETAPYFSMVLVHRRGAATR